MSCGWEGEGVGETADKTLLFPTTEHSDLVLDLLSPKKSLKWKKRQLENHIPLVINIAASCPTVAGS